jgi:hypothetical protein
MFYGIQNAVHYLDHFGFLHEVMFNIQGAMTSYYQFYTNEEFGLAFDLKVIGPMKDSDDGFMVLLSNNPFRADQLLPSDDTTPKGFENRLSKVGLPDRHPRLLFLLQRHRQGTSLRGSFGEQT